MPMDIINTSSGSVKEGAGGILEVLPDSSITDYILILNKAMSNTLAQYIDDNFFTHIFIQNPLIIMIIFFVAVGSIVMFFDFFVDAWKVPFAIIVDIIDLMAIASPGVLDFIAAGGSIIIFYLLAREPRWARYSFGAIGAIKCLAPIRPISIFPLNTVMMVIATIID